jgi:hypothetical protein
VPEIQYGVRNDKFTSPNLIQHVVGISAIARALSVPRPWLITAFEVAWVSAGVPTLHHAAAIVMRNEMHLFID